MDVKTVNYTDKVDSLLTRCTSNKEINALVAEMDIKSPISAKASLIPKNVTL